MMTISSGAFSVDVKNPEMGDTKAKDLRLGFYRVMSGAVVAYRATPVPKIYNMLITGLTTTQTEDLAALLDARIEYPITFAWGTTTITGIVTNSPEFTNPTHLREIVLEIRE